MMSKTCKSCLILISGLAIMYVPAWTEAAVVDSESAHTLSVGSQQALGSDEDNRFPSDIMAKQDQESESTIAKSASLMRKRSRQSATIAIKWQGSVKPTEGDMDNVSSLLKEEEEKEEKEEDDSPGGGTEEEGFEDDHAEKKKDEDKGPTSGGGKNNVPEVQELPVVCKPCGPPRFEEREVCSQPLSHHRQEWRDNRPPAVVREWFLNQAAIDKARRYGYTRNSSSLKSAKQECIAEYGSPRPGNGFRWGLNDYTRCVCAVLCREYDHEGKQCKFFTLVSGSSGIALESCEEGVLQGGFDFKCTWFSCELAEECIEAAPRQDQRSYRVGDAQEEKK